MPLRRRTLSAARYAPPHVAFALHPRGQPAGHVFLNHIVRDRETGLLGFAPPNRTYREQIALGYFFVKILSARGQSATAYTVSKAPAVRG